ncbi:MAG TPA: hypothetical protein VH234_06265 [Candidatus Saccharimonadales bacterium]|jgi:hypothetical protein|nr:hypothetical protein [Candidatus Saccharimonadales bacterium]
MKIKSGTWLVYCNGVDGKQYHTFINIEDETINKLEKHLDEQFESLGGRNSYVIVNMVYLS